MARVGMKTYFKIVVLSCLLVFSEQCNLGPNVGLGNIGWGNVGVGNLGFGNIGVMNRGARNIGAMNQKAAGTVGVANYRVARRMGVADIITIPNFMPRG